MKVVSVVFDSLWFDTNQLEFGRDSSAGDLMFLTVKASGGYYARATFASIGPGDCQTLFIAWALDSATDKLLWYMIDSACQGYTPSRLVTKWPDRPGEGRTLFALDTSVHQCKLPFPARYLTAHGETYAHCLLAYEDQDGRLYSTYTWARVVPTEVGSPLRFTQRGDEYVAKWGAPKVADYNYVYSRHDAATRRRLRDHLRLRGFHGLD
jgi:hypothetical protein